MECLLDKIKATKGNADFFDSMRWLPPAASPRSDRMDSFPQGRHGHAGNTGFFDSIRPG
jgi:hypothetical protein